MTDIPQLIKSSIFKNLSESEFEGLCLQLFKFQYENNKVYAAYVNTLGVDVSSVNQLNRIPFLPIAFFKSHSVICGDVNMAEQIFQSSSTTSDIPSKHYVKDVGIYRESFLKGFKRFYGNISDYCLLALLPSYLERGNSSLVYMVNALIEGTNNLASGFYMHNYGELAEKLRYNEIAGKKTLLMGVTYALLKLAEEYPMELRNTVIMETGGMKGRREELTKQEVHQILSGAFKTPFIHSEYGMTELLSQAYSTGGGIFECVPWMRVLIRDIYDPFKVGLVNESGAINVVDLANIYSCSFIATDDVGIVKLNSTFEVAGRLDNSDIRGCNIMAAEL